MAVLKRGPSRKVMLLGGLIALVVYGIWLHYTMISVMETYIPSRAAVGFPRKQDQGRPKEQANQKKQYEKRLLERMSAEAIQNGEPVLVQPADPKQGQQQQQQQQQQKQQQQRRQQEQQQQQQREKQQQLQQEQQKQHEQQQQQQQQQQRNDEVNQNHANVPALVKQDQTSYSHCAEEDICYESSPAWRNPCYTQTNARGRTNKKCFPYAMVLGWPKCGTSALFFYITNHPHIIGGRDGRKEMDFFSFWFPNGKATLPAYSAWFEQPKDKDTLIVEGSTEYAANKQVPGLIHKTLPHTKFIVLLRNPADQVYSYFQMRRKFTHDALPGQFTRWVKQFMAGKTQCARGCLTNWNANDCTMTSGCLLMSRAIYVDWLENWFSLFDRSAFLIRRTEELWINPTAIVRNVESFLGLEEHTYSKEVLEEQVNVGGRGDIYDHQKKSTKKVGGLPPMDMETRKALVEFFHPFNQRLEKLLDWDVSADWDTPASV